MISVSAAAERVLFIGSYTKAKKNEGITRLKMDPETGALRHDGLAAESDSPSFLAADPAGKFLYAVNEQPSGVTAWRVETATGALTLLNKQPVTEGAGPCHLTVDASGRVLVTANYGGGSAEAFALQPDGGIGPRSAFIQHTGSGGDKKRQDAPHAHGAHLSPDGKNILIPDLGLDRVFIYAVDPAKASLTPSSHPFGSTAPAAGPRHGAFHPSLPLFFCINELNSTITSFVWNAAEAKLTAGPVISTLPEGFSGKNSTAEIAVHPGGKFVYGSNRGHDSIAVFKIEDPATGGLSLLQHLHTGGKEPRHFTLDPSGRWLLAANQNSHTVKVFRVDPEKGTLQETEHSVSVGSPVCILFPPEPQAS